MADKEYDVVVGDQIPAAVIGKYADIVSKAIEDPSKTDGTKDLEHQDYFYAMRVAEETADILETNKEILELFPDIELATEIRMSAILDPNSQQDNELKIKFRKSSAPAEVTGRLIPIVKSNLEDIDLKKILKESLVEKGAYIEAIIPEPLLDKIILANIEEESVNKSNKNKKKPVTVDATAIEEGLQSIDASKLEKREFKKENFSLGILNKNTIADDSKLLSDSSFKDFLKVDGENTTTNKKAILENIFKINDTIITDNILEIKSINSAMLSANNTIKDKLSIFKKSRSKITDKDIKQLFSKTKKKKEDFMALPAVKASYNKGQSLVVRLPVSSTIPIYPSGEPNNHIGYFVLINPKTGVPIRDEEFAERKAYMNNNINNVDKQADVGGLISTVIENMKGYNNSQDITLRDIDKTYSRLLDLKIKSVLKDTVFDDIVEVDIEANDAYRVMLARVLESKDTKMIFMPKELVSYVAFDYRKNGTGKSLIEKISFFASLRATVLFTNLMAKMSNSMSNTVVNGEIDEFDRNPKGAKSSIISNFMNARGTKIPLYMFKPRELANWANGYGIQFNIKHPSFGMTQVTTEEKQGAGGTVDTDLEDLLFQYILYSIGVNKESLDAAKNDDYATSVVARSKFFARRIASDQKIFAPLISSLIQKRISYNIIAYEQIKEVVTEEFEKLSKNYLEDMIGKDEAEVEREKAKQDKEPLIELLTELLIEDLEMFLPAPEVTDDTNSVTLFNNFKESLDTVLEAIISDDLIIDDAGGEANVIIKNDLIKIVKSVSMMNFLRDNNHMQGLTNLFSLDADGEVLSNPIEQYASFIEALSSAAISSKEKILKYNLAINKKLAKVEEKLGATDTTSDSNDGYDGGAPAETPDSIPDEVPDNIPENNPDDMSIGNPEGSNSENKDEENI